jgi:hypothetical protein
MDGGVGFSAKGPIKKQPAPQHHADLKTHLFQCITDRFLYRSKVNSIIKLETMGVQEVLSRKTGVIVGDDVLKLL